MHGRAESSLRFGRHSQGCTVRDVSSDTSTQLTAILTAAWELQTQCHMHITAQLRALKKAIMLQCGAPHRASQVRMWIGHISKTKKLTSRMQGRSCSSGALTGVLSMPCGVKCVESKFSVMLSVQ